MMEINQGDIVKIPQKVVLYNYDDLSITAIWTCPKPLAAVFIELVNKSNKELAELLIDNELWYTEPENLHQWREYAS